MHRVMWHIMGQVEKKGHVSIFLYKFQRLLGIAFCEQILINWGFYYLFIDHQGQWRISLKLPLSHIIAVGNAVVIIKALTHRKNFRLISQVPFTYHCGGISRTL